MGVSRKLLTEGEEVVLSVRTHVKVLALPVLVLLVTCGVGGYLVALVQDTGGSAGALTIAVLAVGAVVLVWWVLRPFLRWFTTSYTITNRRLIEQKGILTRSGRVIPLNLVNDVAFEKNLNDRLLGCGTLVVSNASEQSGLRLPDVPHVESVHRTLSTLVFDVHRQRGDDERV
ncbi:MAG: PH domain-containing protein [Nocardioidaceae bacterium]|nr:PH domain-containing protein [Nocardioidaceae bacterium]